MDNPHFQILLDFFQRKFDWDAWLCTQKRHRGARARALFKGSRGKDDDEKTRQAATNLRAGPSSSAIFDEDRDGSSTDHRDHEAPPLGNVLHRKILRKLKSLVPR